MSAVTSQSRFNGVVINATAQAVVAGAALAGLLLRAAGSAVRAAAGPALARVAEGGVIPPLCAVRDGEAARLGAVAAAAGVLDPVDRIRVEAAASLAGYVIGDPEPLTAPLRSLQAAATPSEAMRARDTLLQATQAEHQALFTQHVVSACISASTAAGFPAVETRVTTDGTVRLVATNLAGHALVSEFRTSPEGEPALETEVVGVHDGSCGDIPDRFDAALEIAGVRAAPPRRRHTGGVCELAAARDFVRRALQPKSEVRASAEPDRAVNRRRNARSQTSQQR